MLVLIDGSEASFSNHPVSWLLRIFDISLTAGGMAIMRTLISGKGQHVGDVAASTYIISEKIRIGLNKKLLQAIPDEYIRLYPQMMMLSDKQLQSIKQIKNEAL